MKYSLSRYFNLKIEIPLTNKGGVQKGYHGIEERDGEFYVSHFHLKNFVAFGPMKGFVNNITSAELFREASNENPDFRDWPKVKYFDYEYEIQKYKLSWLIEFYSSEKKEYRGANDMIISFTNFRRFKYFDPIQLSGVNFFVGKNNSGKSTVVKAILLVQDYLQNQQGASFSFAKSVLNDVNIVTFDRAVNSETGDRFIEFQYSNGNVSCILTISGVENSTKASVIKIALRNRKGQNIKIDNLKKTVKWEVDFGANIGSLNKNNDRERAEAKQQMIYFDKEIARIKSLLQETENTFSKEYLSLKQELNFILDKRDLFRKNLEKNRYFIDDIFVYGESFTPDTMHLKNVKGVEFDFYSEVETSSFHNLGKFIKYQIESIRNESYLQTFKHKTLSESEKKVINENIYFANKIAHSEFGNLFFENLDETLSHFEKDQFVYLGANPAKQNALFLIRDAGNPLAQAIHEFHQNIHAEQPVNRSSFKTLKGFDSDQVNYITNFVKRWMKVFEIGDDFQIEIRAGEAYEVIIHEKNGKSFNQINLSDKGMGSLQVMMILFRLASLIKINANETKRVHILVEEPELNLHPALQSKLTELFYEVHEEYGFNFIIETHSEYIIRKSQVLVKETNYSRLKSKHPFKVYYFDVEKGPYEMRYREDGLFIDEFGSGFFDVSANLTFDIL